MYFDSFADFIAMGGHGKYVWMSYGFFLMVMIWNLFYPRFRRHQVLESARRYWQRADSEAAGKQQPLPDADQDS